MGCKLRFAGGSSGGAAPFALGGGLGVGEAAAAVVLAVHAALARAPGGFVVEGAVVGEVGLDALAGTGVLKFLADDAGVLVGAHGKRGAQGGVPVLAGVAGGLLEAQAVAGPAAGLPRRAGGGGVAFEVAFLVRDHAELGLGGIADAAGGGLPGLGVVDAFHDFQPSARGPLAQGGQAVGIFLGRVDVRVRVEHDGIDALRAQNADRLQGARSAAGVQKKPVLVLGRRLHS